MATLEDKILGDDKRENYCSSDEGDDEPSGISRAAAESKASTGQTYFTRESEAWSGSSTNTGPKGVIKDWQRFKQLETERSTEKESERSALSKKLCITSKTVAEDEEQARLAELEQEIDQLMVDDGYLLTYQQERMREMLAQCGRTGKRFGNVFSLTDGDEFLKAIDNEDKSITVIVHIYESKFSACKTMNKCLDELAKSYGMVKFCKIISSVAGLSRTFNVSGVPALLVYKSGNLIGNFVRLTDDLGGEEFFTSDVESFLIEHAMLPDKSHVPTIVTANDDLD